MICNQTSPTTRNCTLFYSDRHQTESHCDMRWLARQRPLVALVAGGTTNLHTVALLAGSCRKRRANGGCQNNCTRSQVHAIRQEVPHLGGGGRLRQGPGFRPWFWTDSTIFISLFRLIQLLQETWTLAKTVRVDLQVISKLQELRVNLSLCLTKLYPTKT
jgi:hypothetical protein